MSKALSRRSFLKATVAGTVAAASATLIPTMATTAESADPTAAVSQASTAENIGFTPVGSDCTYGAYLNPQDPTATSNTKPLSKLFSPLKIGGVTMKNRIMKSAAGSEMQDNYEWPSDAALAYYGEFSKGGVGMICYESSTVVPMMMPGAIPGMPDMAAEMPDLAGAIPGMPDGGMSVPGMPEGAAAPKMFSLDITSDEGIPAHKAIADHMHAIGTPVIAQMYDMMMASGGSSTAVHAFDLETSFASGKMQTTEEIKAEIGYFVDAAERYFKAGYDGVEINCSCNHYFSTYLSRFANNERTDEYGGQSIENRARIVTEIIEGIRARVGQDFIVQVLYSGVEENIAALGDNEYCTSIEEACEFAKLFEKAGASSLHIRSQAYGHHCGGFMPDVLHIPEHGHTGYGTVLDFGKHFSPVLGQYDGAGALLEVAGMIKSCVSIPVGAVGSMDPRLTPDLIENAIEDGKIDFILMTRPLMADMHYCEKLESGRRDEIAPCTHCMTCFVAPYAMGTPMYCRVNASLTRAFTEDMPEGYDPLPTANPMNVMVIGGGPAGMEAARIAASRGHSVSLYEKEEELGTVLCKLAAIKGPHEKIMDHRTYLINELNRNGVKVYTGTEVTADLVRSESPDAIIAAVGGLTARPAVPGIENTVPAISLAEGIEGDSFVILGAQFEACEAAIHLAKRGKTVTIINEGPSSELYLNGATWPAMMGKRWLHAKGVKMYHQAKLESIAADGVSIVSAAGVPVTIKADVVINALPQQPNRALADELSDVCKTVICVGNCYSGSTIANAIARANIIARRLGDVEMSSATLEGDHVYTAKANGIGEVTVSIRVEDGKIVEAMVDTSAETQGIGRDLGEKFAQQIVANGEVDAASGATVTTNAVRDALRLCMEQAGI